LPPETFPTTDVLALYRLRWQIELCFKRFKSLAGLDQLPAKSEDLARAWIYAKLITVLLAERLAGTVPDSPPSGSGPSGPRIATRKPIAMAMRQTHPRQPAHRHPRRPALGDHPRPALGMPTLPPRAATKAKKASR
jgi:hypothetical protein